MKGEVANLKYALARHHPPTYESLDSCQQVTEAEWLHEVVIGARIEPPKPIAGVVARCQQQDGCSIPQRTEVAADLDAVRTWKHDVKQENVVGRTPCEVQPLLTVRCDIDTMVSVAQPFLQCRTEPTLVLDEQQSRHRALLRESGIASG
jgi:hypothetical protein